MSRKRMIHPAIWQDEDFGSLSDRGKILFIGMFSNADDEGRLLGNPAYLKSTIFMYDDISLQQVEQTRDEVANKMKSVKVYTVNNKSYIQLSKWNEYQKQHKDRVQESSIPPYQEDVSDNVGQMTDNVGVVKVSIDKVSIGKDSLVKYDKNSDEFSQLKEDLGIGEPVRGITTEHQAEGIRIAKALYAPSSRYSAYIKACKEEPRKLILEAFGFVADYKPENARDKMFFWKLNELKGDSHAKSGESN